MFRTLWKKNARIFFLLAKLGSFSCACVIRPSGKFSLPKRRRDGRRSCICTLEVCGAGFAIVTQFETKFFGFVQIEEAAEAEVPETTEVYLLYTDDEDEEFADLPALVSSSNSAEENDPVAQ